MEVGYSPLSIYILLTLGNISHVSTEEHIATDTNLIPR